MAAPCLRRRGRQGRPQALVWRRRCSGTTPPAIASDDRAARGRHTGAPRRAPSPRPHGAASAGDLEPGSGGGRDARVSSRRVAVQRRSAAGRHLRLGGRVWAATETLGLDHGVSTLAVRLDRGCALRQLRRRLDGRPRAITVTGPVRGVHSPRDRMASSGARERLARSILDSARATGGHDPSSGSRGSVVGDTARPPTSWPGTVAAAHPHLPPGLDPGPQSRRMRLT